MRKTKAKSRREQQGLRWLHSITVSMDMNLSKLQEKVARETWCALVSEVTKSQTWLCKWTTVAITVSTSDLVQFSSVAQLCPTLCNPVNHSTPGFPVHHQLSESTQNHVRWVDGAIQPSHPLLSPSLPGFNLSQHQGLFQWVSSSYQVAKVLEFQLQHESFHWTPRTDFL